MKVGASFGAPHARLEARIRERRHTTFPEHPRPCVLLHDAHFPRSRKGREHLMRGRCAHTVAPQPTDDEEFRHIKDCGIAGDPRSPRNESEPSQLTVGANQERETSRLTQIRSQGWVPEASI